MRYTPGAVDSCDRNAFASKPLDSLVTAGARKARASGLAFALLVEQAVAHREPGELDVVGDAELLEQPVAIRAHRLGRQAESIRDRLRRVALGHHQHHLRLALRELLERRAA